MRLGLWPLLLVYMGLCNGGRRSVEDMRRGVVETKQKEITASTPSINERRRRRKAEKARNDYQSVDDRSLHSIPRQTIPRTQRRTSAKEVDNEDEGGDADGWIWVDAEEAIVSEEMELEWEQEQDPEMEAKVEGANEREVVAEVKDESA